MWKELKKWAGMKIVHIDEGPPNWKAGRHDVTREDVGSLPVSVLRDTTRVDLVRNKYNMSKTNESFRELLNEIKNKGYDKGKPVMVAVEQDGSITIIDGTHRLLIAEMLGIEEVPVVVRYFGNAQRDPKNILGI